MKKITIIIFLILCFIFVTTCQHKIPFVRQRVNDETGTLSPSEIITLERKLFNFERETSNQIVVLLVNSLEGYSLEEFTYRVAEKNKIGKKGKDNGVLLLIAKEDRQMRIEVGYGLEGVLTDALSSQIIRNVIAPYFRNGDFYGGINAGLDAIMLATKGEYEGDSEVNRDRNITLFTIILLLIFFSFFRAFINGIKRRTIGSGGVHSSFPWWWGGFGGGGGFSSGSFGGGFGGFSGGGGSFGGGGASGRW